MADNPFLTEALGYAARGWQVIPLQDRGKIPRIRDWPHNGATAPAQIQAWWQKWPKANVGIVTGAASGLVVLDIDPKNGGDVESLPSKVPDTPTVQTGGGGLHFYFLHPGRAIRNKAGDIAPGVDIRGDGGQVVAPPSIHPSGKQYLWEASSGPDQIPLADAPVWMLEPPQPAAQGGARSGSRFELPLVIPEGTRGNSLFRYASSLRGKAWPPAAILSELHQVNMERCKPPLEPEAISRIADSVAKYTPNVPAFRYVPTSSSLEGQDVEQYQSHGHPLTRLSDSGNAELFAHYNAGKFLFDHSRGIWLRWAEHWWTPDAQREIVLAARTTARRRAELAATVLDLDKKGREEAFKFALQSESQRAIQSALELAKSEPTLRDNGTGWDESPYRFGVANGVFDLTNGTLTPGDPQDKVSKHSPYPYIPDAEAPRWEQYLREVLPGPDGEADIAMIQFLQRAVGYSLTGSTKEKKLFILIGEPDTGKSVFLRVLSEVMGDYAVTNQFTMFERAPTGSNATGLSPGKVRLRGVRFGTCLEVRQDTRWDEGLIKGLTGGDLITARGLHQAEVTFAPTCKLWFGLNHLPKVTDTSQAFFERVLPVQFPRRIPREKQDRELLEKLLKEAPGILRWAFDGAAAWFEKGLAPPESITERAEAYARDNDTLLDFVESMIEQAPGENVTGKALYEAYKTWCEQSGETPLANNIFARRLKDRGHTSHKGNKGMIWKGIALKTHPV